MKSHKSHYGVASFAGFAALALTLSSCGSDADNGNGSGNGEQEGNYLTDGEPLGDHGLPETLVFSSYSVGTGTYAEVGALSEALTSEYDISVRQLPSDTGIGRLSPLTDGQANYARTSLEYMYSFEADYEYASEEWGPQDIRTVWTPPTNYGVGVTSASGIDVITDLEGKRVPWAPGNPSAQSGILGLLAYAGLTIDDVETVSLGYGDWPDALRNGEIDLLYYTINAANILEVDASTDFKWIDLEDGDVDAFQEVGSTYLMADFESPVGMEGQDTKSGFSYTLPVVTYAEYSEEEVYTFVKAIDETFDSYRNITDTTPNWDINIIDWIPAGVPHHDGLVRYLDEQGLWSDEAQAAQDELVERRGELVSGWDEFLDGEGGDLSDEDKADAWQDWKEENLDS